MHDAASTVTRPHPELDKQTQPQQHQQGMGHAAHMGMGQQDYMQQPQQGMMQQGNMGMMQMGMRPEAPKAAAKPLKAHQPIWQSQIWQRVFPKIHPAGWPFVCVFALVTAALALLHPLSGALGLVLTGWCIFFYRDPDRIVPRRDGLIMAPADGMVAAIKQRPMPAELRRANPHASYTCVSIFLDVFDVHVNRVPADAVIEEVRYRKGRHFRAELDKSSDHNERNTMLMRLKDGRRMAISQIAGTIGRRIVSNIEPQQTVKAGERFGIIRFGSRVDIYLPRDVHPLADVGQRMIGGETIIADLLSYEPRRKGDRI